MKNPSPKQIVHTTSLFSSLIIFALLLLTKIIIKEPLYWVIIFLLPVLSYFIIYKIQYQNLEKFIFRKIKVIYKNIHSRKTSKPNPTQKLDLGRDLIEEANDEVIEWAENQAKEIEQLKRLENFRKEFLGNVSHELKTPLFSIQGYIETLIEGGLYDEKINLEYLHKAGNNVERLIHIVADLEDISLLESGKLNLNIQTFDIWQLTGEIFDTLEMSADAEDITLGFKKGCELPFWVRADRDRIRQVLINLINNSIRYGKPGGKTRIGFYEMGDNILVEVSDDGIGIKEENLPRLFERFYRTDKARSRAVGGTGLGLSIVKHIIEAHHQTIHVRSTEGLGSTFGFTLKSAEK